MEDNSEFNTLKNSQKNQEKLLRKIFLNLLIDAFIIMTYFYISEIFGSISTIYIDDSELFIYFGVTLLIFTIFSIFAGFYHGFIAGFIGEFLYQLAYYDSIYLHWCFIIGIWGLICGLYKYKPLKYQERIKILYTSLVLILSSFIIMGIIIYSQNIFNSPQLDKNTLILNYGFNFFIQTLISIVFIVPIILFLYDKAFATRERHLYYILFTHHPFSMSDHTFYFKFGRTYIYLCSRCSGVIIGGMFAFFFTRLIERIYNCEFSQEVAIFLCIILPIPGLIDWGTQRMLLRTSTTESRLFTGFIIGNALHFMSFTNKYYFFMLFLLILYFSILGLIMYFGHKKEMKKLKEEPKDEYFNFNKPIFEKNYLLEMTNIIFIHGLESSGQGFKGKLFQKVLPGILTPNFKPYQPGTSTQILLEERMAQLIPILEEKQPWIIIGSSFGGLMGTLYTCRYPEKVAKLILLAPLLEHPELHPNKCQKINIPVVIYHGKNDKIVRMNPSRNRAERLFLNLKYNAMDDDHMLHDTVRNINWLNLTNIS